jgi:DNA replication protein DnaC
MRYDDWESDEPIVYQRADVEIVSNPYANYSSRHPVYEPEHNVIEQKGRPTPERYAHPTPATPVPTPAQPAQPAYESAREQRMTQPLKPKSNGGAGAEYEQGGPTVPQTPQPSSPRPTRQLTPAPREANEVNRRLATVRTPCPYCKGAGYLRANVPFGHPQFGKPQPCVCKEQEKREKRRQQLLELSDLRAFRNRSFSNFNTRFQGMHPSVQEAFDAAYSFAQNPNGWLLLVGPNGCGKTHLAAAIANHCLSEGEIVLFSVVPELLDHLRAAFAPSSSEVYDQLFARMREAGLLVLDDLGAHYGTPWAAEKLFQLLNYRYNWRMPTVITSNVPGLQSLDIRLRSRMADNSLVVTINLERARDCRPYLIRQEP